MVAIIDGNNYTQLTFLNVTEVLRIDGAIVTAGGGGGGITGPGTSTLTAIPRWGDTAGASLLDSGVLIDANNNMDFNLQGSETTVGIWWDDGARDIRQYYDNGSFSLIFDAMEGRDFSFMSWDNDGASNSTLQGTLLVQNDMVALDVLTWSGGSPTGLLAEIALTQTDPAITITDSLFSKGMVYAGDYSGAYVPRSIVDKAYVDAHPGDISGPSTSTVNAIPRWGDSTGDSLLDSGNLIDANNNMTFNLEGSETTVGIFWDDGADKLRQYYDSFTNSLIFDGMEAADFNVISWSNDGETNSTNQGIFVVEHSDVSIGVATWSGGSPTGSLAEIAIAPSDPTITITDSLHDKGMVYAGDYSAKYVDRSIVDKAWIDDQLSTIGITGPATSTDTAMVIWDDATGDAVESTTITVDANNLMTFGNVSGNLQGFIFQGTNQQLTYNHTTGQMIQRIQQVGEIITDVYNTNLASWTFRTQIDLQPETIYLSAATGSLGAIVGELSIEMDANSQTFIVTDTIASKGMAYADDYSSAYGDRSIVDKLYVDGHPGDIGGPATSTQDALPRWNNLTGSLLADSSVILDDNGLFTLADVSNNLQGFNFADTQTQTTYQHSVRELTTHLANIGDPLDATLGQIVLSGTDELEADFVWRGRLEVDENAYLASQTGDGLGGVAAEKSIKLEAFLGATGGMLVTDNINFKGLEYAADYSGAFSTNSLVDKAYVDALVAGVTTYYTLTSASSTATIDSADILVADTVYIIKDATGAASGAAPQTIETEGSEEIDGSTDDVLIEVPYGSLRLYSDGTDLWSF